MSWKNRSDEKKQLYAANKRRQVRCDTILPLTVASSAVGNARQIGDKTLSSRSTQVNTSLGKSPMVRASKLPNKRPLASRSYLQLHHRHHIPLQIHLLLSFPLHSPPKSLAFPSATFSTPPCSPNFKKSRQLHNPCSSRLVWMDGA